MDNTRQREIISGVVDVLKTYGDPQRIWIFGSRAKGRNRENSDFDFAVEGDPPAFNSAKAKITFDEKLDKTLGLYSADIIYLNEVDDDFRNIVFKTGEVIYERGS